MIFFTAAIKNKTDSQIHVSSTGACVEGKGIESSNKYSSKSFTKSMFWLMQSKLHHKKQNAHSHNSSASHAHDLNMTTKS